MKVIIGSCGVNWKAAVTVAELIIVLFEGIEVTRTLNVIVATPSADKEPILIPVSGRIFGIRSTVNCYTIFYKCCTSWNHI